MQFFNAMVPDTKFNISVVCSLLDMNICISLEWVNPRFYKIICKAVKTWNCSAQLLTYFLTLSALTASF